MSESNDFDLSTNNGERDIWILKIDIYGNIIWSKSYGGSDMETIYDFKQLENGDFILTGYSSSLNFDIGENNGERDFWVALVNSEGDIKWSNNIGGSKSDEAVSIELTSDGGYVIIGYSESNDFDVQENKGSSDVWVVKLSEMETNISYLENNLIYKLYPNPANDIVNLELDDSMKNARIEIFDAFGKTWISKVFTGPQIKLKGLAKGIYWVKIESAEFMACEKIIIN